MASLLPQSCPTYFFVRKVHLFPIFSFDAFVQRMAEGIPVGFNQERTPSFLFNVVDIYQSLRRPHFFSSQRQLIRVFPDNHFQAPFWCFRLSYLKCFRAPAQGSNIKGALIVNLSEFTQAVCKTFSALLTPGSSQYSARGRLHLLADSPTTLMY